MAGKNKLVKEAENCVYDLGIEVRVSIGLTTRWHLRNLKPYVFTIEMRRFGKVVWGDSSILGLIPDYAWGEIKPIDGFILLNNRIVEQLMLLQKMHNEGYLCQYDIDKGYIQIVNSLLVLQGQYRGLYPQKREVFCKTLSGSKALGDKSDMLVSRINAAFENVNNKDLARLVNQSFSEEWGLLRDAFRQVWLHEVRTLLKDDRLDLAQAIEKFISLPGFLMRVKGWLKVILRGKHMFCAGRLKNLLLSSPQFLIYQNAVALYFSEQLEEEKMANIIKDWQLIVK